jgi:hypothetical protein
MKSPRYAITFRVDENEYRELLRAVNIRAARSVAEFARLSVIDHIVSEQKQILLDGYLKDVDRYLEAFEDAIREFHLQLRQILRTLSTGKLADRTHRNEEIFRKCS